MVQTADWGCIVIDPQTFESNKIVCAGGKGLTLVNGPDGSTRMTVYSGFPIWDFENPFVIPKYKQEYAWFPRDDWQHRYYHVNVDQNNCVQVSRECSFLSFIKKNLHIRSVENQDDLHFVYVQKPNT